MKKILLSFITVLLFSGSAFAAVEKYKIDIKGTHAFIQFRIKHLGYSWLYGRFNEFDGNFELDRNNLENSKINVKIDVTSIDTNHAERDIHLKAEELLYTEEYPDASFVSTSLKLDDSGKAGILSGNLTLRGVTKPIDIKVVLVGEGDDPWGGYRAGFQGDTSFALKDFGINRDLGPESTVVEIILSIEGIRQ